MNATRPAPTSTPPTKAAPASLPAPQCQSMAEVRSEVDRLDKALVKLLAERQTYMEAAGRLKTTRHTVRDEARVEEVIRNILAEAAKLHLNPAIAEPVWRTLIEQSIAHEFQVFDRLNTKD